MLVTWSDMVKMKAVLVLLGLALVQGSQDVMKEMSKQFAKPMEICRKEMDLPDSVTKDFMNFWKEGYELQDRATGCAIMCLSSKLDLLDEAYNLHHGNAKEFAKKHGADEGLAQKLVDLIHGCMKKVPEGEGNDFCMRTLLIAKCFKAEIHQLDWAPNMEIIVADVLAEV